MHIELNTSVVQASANCRYRRSSKYKAYNHRVFYLLSGTEQLENLRKTALAIVQFVMNQQAYRVSQNKGIDKNSNQKNILRKFAS